jgi:hypothetical protein
LVITLLVIFVLIAFVGSVISTFSLIFSMLGDRSKAGAWRKRMLFFAGMLLFSAIALRFALEM